MNWTEVTIETAKAGLDLLCAMLTDLGFKGFSVFDPDDFDDLMAGRVGHWDYLEEGLQEALTSGEPSVTVYVPENAQGAEQMTAVRSLLEQLRSSADAALYGSLKMTSKGIREEDWANNWKQYFKPLPVGERLWITPTWVDEPVPDGRTALHIDPGSSFGTGQHDTTKLCLGLLETVVKPGSRVLDIGCGSGILSIGAMLLGAGDAYAIDIEQNAAEAAAENAERNGIPAAHYHTFCGNILDDAALADSFGTGYDVVCANIVADILIAMKGLFVRYLADGAALLLSGIIDERLDEVLAAVDTVGLHTVKVEQSAGWAAVLMRK
ncbi:MAG: 50S ribosomal protein L11 methyltransferase [Oscillospiraceae bacterium]|nr:50S ribosomal protein L11 methyltransferase [Oscillospiraceae bacterium]